MRLLISSGHYFFTDKVGSEPGWAVDLVNSLAGLNEVNQIDVIVGTSDVEKHLNHKIRVVALYKGRSNNQYLEFVKLGAYYPLVFLVSTYFLLTKRYDIVHHMLPLSTATFNPSIILAKLLNKNVRTVLGPLQLPQSKVYRQDLGILLTGSNAEHNSKVNILSTVYHWAAKIAAPLSNLMFKFTDLVVVNSTQAKNYYLNRINCKKIVVIPTGILPPNNVIPKSIKNNSTLNIINVAQLSERKGQEFLIEAAVLLKKSGINFKIDFFGEGEIKDKLLNLTSKYGLKSHIRFNQHIPSKALGKHYLKCDIYCQPSISDPSPSSIIEAMSYGTPVVASNVGSIPEMIHGCGILTRTGSPSDLSAAIMLLVKKPKLYTKYSEEAINKIHSHYSWVKIAACYYRAYITL